MTDIKIKQNLHTLIDNLQDVRILKLVHEAVCEIIEDKRLKWNSLSENERRSIETGIEQLDKGEKINNIQSKNKEYEIYKKYLRFCHFDIGYRYFMCG